MKLKIKFFDIQIEAENATPELKNPEDGSTFFLHDMMNVILDGLIEKRIKFEAAMVMAADEVIGDIDSGDTPPAPQMPGTEIKPNPQIEIESRQIYQ